MEVITLTLKVFALKREANRLQQAMWAIEQERDDAERKLAIHQARVKELG